MEPPIDPPTVAPVSRRRRALAFSLGLALVLLALALTFNHVLTTESTKLSGLWDAHRYFGPQSFYLDVCIHSGQFPLWNPLTFGGMPYAANPQTAIFYPPHLLRSLLTFSPTPYRTQFGMVVMMGLHLLLAFGGTYLLARAHRISRSGSWTAALAFTFSALMVRRVCEYHFAYTLNWLPLLLFLAKRLLDERSCAGKMRWGAAAGLVFGMAALGGFLQIVNYMGVVLAVYALLYRLLHPRANRELAGAAMVRAWGLDGAALGVAAAVTLLVGGALLFPAMELSKLTGRQPGTAILMYSDLFNRSWTGIAQDLAVYAGMKYDNEALRGSGLAALTLAIAALLTARRRDVLLFLGLYLVLLDCSFGPPLPISSLVDKLTPFAQSAYTRAYDLALLPLSLLAGLGVDGIARKSRSWRWALSETLPLAVIGGTLLLLLWNWIHPEFYLGVSFWVVALPASALLVMLAAHAFPRLSGAAVLLPLLVFLETLSWNVHYVPMLTHLRVPPMPEKTASMPQDNHRQTDAIPNRQLFQMRNVTNGYEPLCLRKTWEVLIDPSPTAKYSRVARKDTMSGNQRTNLLLKRPFWLARQWVDAPLPGMGSLFPAATTVFLPDAEGLATPQADGATVKNSGVSEDIDRQSVMTSALGAAVKAGKKVRKELRLNLPTALDGRPAGLAGAVHSVLRLTCRCSCSGTIEPEFRDRATDQLELGRRIRLNATDGTTVELPLPDFTSMDVSLTVTALGGKGTVEITGADLLSDNDDEDGLIKIAARRANRVDLDIGPLDGPRILAYLDAWYPGWHAYVDDAEVPLLRADDGFKAVEVPIGTHHVAFVFRPVRIYAGIAVSLATLFTLAVLAAALRKWERSRMPLSRS